MKLQINGSVGNGMWKVEKVVNERRQNGRVLVTSSSWKEGKRCGMEWMYSTVVEYTDIIEVKSG